jgi:dTDP-L-rhamnose 4-epimerase
LSERILVTGGAGFIGSHLVDALLNAGHHVRVFDNLDPQVHGGLLESGQWPDYLNPDCERVLGDVRDRDALAKALAGIDVIYHQAAAVGVGQSMYDIERYVDVNTHGTAVLLDILANDAHRIRKLIVASSMSIYGEGQYSCAEHGNIYPQLRSEEQMAAGQWEMQCPICGRQVDPRPTSEDKPLHSTSIYALTKKDQEEMCLMTGNVYKIPTVALRYFNAYGARQALSNPYTGVAAIFSGRLLNNQAPVVFEDGLQSRDPTHVSDIVQANFLALERENMDGRAYNVGTGRAFSILDTAQSLIHHLGSPLTPQVLHKFRAGDIRHCYADISRIQAMGYQPTVRFEEGIAELVEWVRSQAHAARQEASQATSFEQARKELETRGLV